MLRLTYSSCRYVILPCEKIIYTEIKEKTVTISGRSCSVNRFLSKPLAATSINSGQQLRFLAYVKKRSRTKNPVQRNTSKEPKKSTIMSESLQPTLNHASCGGQFEVSPEDCTSHWAKSENTNSNKKEKCGIPPDFRTWETVLKKNDANDGKTIRFKILSYNVLAQCLLECHPYLYTDCSPYNLKWKVRAAKLFEEISKLAPDILCLQEVQASHISSFYNKFEEIGYRGVFKQKTGQRHDGCAIYYKESLFQLTDHCGVEFYQPELPILNRDNIGVMVKLLPKSGAGSPFVVATTHLLYNPKRTDVRLAQIQVFLAEIDRFAYNTSEGESGHMPIILTGDLNSTPDSAVIKLLDQGRVSAAMFQDSSDWKRIGVMDNCQHLSVFLNRPMGLATELSMTKLNNSELRDNVREDARYENYESNFLDLFNSGVISHSLNLTSAYTKYKQDGSYEATTFQNYWVTVDYIYFSYCSKLRLVERLRLPTALECDVLGRLPNDAYASDHLALAAVFELARHSASPVYNTTHTHTNNCIGTA